MIQIKNNNSNIFIALIGVTIFTMYACNPKVLSFIASPNTIVTAKDSVKFYWKLVHGEAVLLFSQEEGDDEENPGKQYLYYKLIARKGSKLASSTTLAITVLKDTAIDNIVLSTFRRGDSLIGTGIKDTLEWGRKFMLNGVMAIPKRKMHIEHLKKVADVGEDGRISTAINGVENSGDWYIGTLLTDAEKKDSSIIPDKLKLKTIIIHQN